MSAGDRPGAVVVTGGAGMIGSHLCAALVARGDRVICVDDLSSGSARNVSDLDGDPAFRLVVADVTEGLSDVTEPVGGVVHLASPASPADYLARPLETLAAGSKGTEAALGLAHRDQARFVLGSTSEVYGEPVEHPQRESYWGNVNPIGVRSVYDESKRFAEALTMAWHRARGTEVGIARIFNTYGPRMREDDGRVVSNFAVQALRGEPLTVYGDGSQTRCFCYVEDTVRGIVAMLDSDVLGPINLGSPDERSMKELADLVLQITGSKSAIEHRPLREDDPTRRRPDISAAHDQLGWAPTVGLLDGLGRTVEFFRGAGSAREGPVPTE